MVWQARQLYESELQEAVLLILQILGLGDELI